VVHVPLEKTVKAVPRAFAGRLQMWDRFDRLYAFENCCSIRRRDEKLRLIWSAGALLSPQASKAWLDGKVLRCEVVFRVAASGRPKSRRVAPRSVSVWRFLFFGFFIKKSSRRGRTLSVEETLFGPTSSATIQPSSVPYGPRLRPVSYKRGNMN